MESRERWWEVFRYVERVWPFRYGILCPTNRMLACLITGRIRKKLRKRLVAHIKMCGRCLEAVVEVENKIQRHWEKDDLKERAERM